MPSCVSRGLPSLWLSAVLSAASFILASRTDAAASDRIDFNSQIRPILSDRCFRCHGPDEKARKAKLRLDTPEGIRAVLDEKEETRAFVPRDLGRSEAWRRIVSSDPDEKMPPPDSKLTLSRAEIDLVEKWIRQGAEHPEKSHWSLNPVRDVPVPRVGEGGAVRNEIDAFVLDRLQREGLKQSPEASAETLLRRLALDLTGLPPTIEEVDRFLADPSREAYERAIDQYLASPHYGERVALDWLDLSRYADTYGYQADVDCDLSPWRDWVIKAFNENLSYDQFIEWQIAGDLLPNATREQKLATAFNRLHRQTNEGGSIEEEFRAEYVADRVHTFGTAFLGLTLECARCHDHKYDPIKQKEYYSLSAFFNNIDESGLYSHFTRATPTPTFLLYGDGVEEKHRELKQQVAAKESALASIRTEARERFEAWRKANSSKIHMPEPVAWYTFDAITSNATSNVVGTNTASLRDGPLHVEGRFDKALQFSGDNEVVCKGAGAFKRTDPFSFSLWLKPQAHHDRAVILHRSRAWTDSGSRGYELLIEDGKPSFALIHFYPGNAIHVRANKALPTNEWSHLAVTYDGSSRATALKLFLDGEPLGATVVRDHLYRDIVHRAEWGDSDVGSVELTLAGRFRDSGFKDGAIDDVKVFDRTLTSVEIRALARNSDVDGTDAEVFEAYLAKSDDVHRRASDELKQLREAESALANSVREIMTMEEMPEPRPTFVLRRGAYNMPADRVERTTPAAILPLPDDYPRNRLGLARWLTDRRNPLVARVVVNRIWRMHFGRGIVATQEDFGSQGQLPTHPELLDWLADWFMDNRWNVKALHKLIVSSATYRQSSDATVEAAAKDPENHLLARGPKHRLAAEQVRDSALAAAGLLNRHIGGPSVKPYQPAGVWEESGTGKTYHQDKGDKLHRRSLYTFWRRTAPPPSMLTFDAPTREVCTAKRETTATPLQALVLLNDAQFIEAARVLAEKLVRESPGSVDDRAARAFRLATGRAPLAKEMEILRTLFNEQLAYFNSQPKAAEEYLAIGETPRDKSLPVAELAATTVLANCILNHDEFVTKR